MRSTASATARTAAACGRRSEPPSLEYLTVRAVQPDAMNKHGALLLFPGVLVLACQPKEVDVTEPGLLGEECNPNYDATNDPEGRPCSDGLACEPVYGDAKHVCGELVEIHGQVIDVDTEAPIAGALVNGLDRTGAPLGQIATSDEMGNYVLAVSAPRNADGTISEEGQFTLQSFAADYQPFPSGIRVALPISAADAVLDDATDTWVIENPSTTVGLIMLPPEQRGGVTISGKVLGEAPAGTLVVAEGQEPAPYTVADATGAYTLFNVKAGDVSLHGYRSGLEVVPRALTVADAPQTGIDLDVAAEGVDSLATVDGSVNIVNAAGGSMTSVVLVPVSVFNTNLLRGPVPFGLRAPDPGVEPDIANTFAIRGVPAGTYKVLAAFENDNLVRDPDLTIGGTALQEITVAAGQNTSLAESFKITQALAITSPGRDEPEVVTGTPTFIFEDDSSEDYYFVRVFDVFGEVIWEDLMVPGVSGSATVEVQYGGPALTPGAYYQFRATSVRDKNGVQTGISQTEDLRGVFIAG